MRIGLFGFPLTGKTTMFHLLTGVEPSPQRPRGEAQLAVAKVHDDRLDRLTGMYKPKKVTHATVEYLDMAGVEKGEAAKVLPLDQLRTVDALAHVVRGFRDESIPHGEGDVDPARDAATMETELILADHAIAERRIEKLELLLKKTNQDETRKELELLRRVLETLEQEIPLRNIEFTHEESFRLKGYTFLSLKPLLLVVNADEADAAKLDEGAAAFGLEEMDRHPSTEVVALSAKIEDEIAGLDPGDAAAFREELGIKEPALERTIRHSYHLLGMISFFTVGETECRAWTIPQRTTARGAAGTIHSDMERGFIRAEVVSYDALVAAGSWPAARDAGTLRLEGKDHVIHDGDAIIFRFNV